MREAQTAFPLFRFPFNGASLFLPFSLFTVSFQQRQPFFYLFPFLPFPFNGASPFFTFLPFYLFTFKYFPSFSPACLLRQADP